METENNDKRIRLKKEFESIISYEEYAAFLHKIKIRDYNNNDGTQFVSIIEKSELLYSPANYHVESLFDIFSIPFRIIETSDRYLSHELLESNFYRRYIDINREIRNLSANIHEIIWNKFSDK